MKFPRRFAASAVLPKSKMIVTGGEYRNEKINSVESFNLPNDWTLEKPLPVTISRHCLVWLEAGTNFNSVEYNGNLTQRTKRYLSCYWLNYWHTSCE